MVGTVKVLQIAYKSEITGGERVLIQLCSALVEATHNVHALCPEPGPLPDELKKLGVKVHYIPMKKTYDWSAVNKIRDLIKKEQIDLVHTHGMLVNILGRLACWRAGNVACISTTHLTRDLAGPPRVGGFLAGLKNRWYYRTLDNWTSQFCKKVVAVSLAVKEDLIKQGYQAELVKVIPNGMDPTPFTQVDENKVLQIRQELGVNIDETLFGLVARLSPQKDVATFLRAFAKQNPQSHAFIAGNGPLYDELQEQATSLELSRCHFLGFRRDIPLLLQACDVFVLPSRWEGLPLTVLEAMACSKAVVATAVDGTKEAVVEGETGFLVPPGDWQQMAQRMKQLAENPKERASMGEAGFTRLTKKFLQSRVTEDHMKLYQEVLN